MSRICNSNRDFGAWGSVDGLVRRSPEILFRAKFARTFLADEPGFYFRDSALFARPAEVLSLRNGLPETALQFNPSPYKDSVTYCILGVSPTAAFPLSSWMRQFQVFYLPRPWPLWMRHVDKAHRPVNIDVWIIGLLIVGLSGVFCVYFGLRQTADKAGQNEFAIPLDEPIESLAPLL